MILVNMMLTFPAVLSIITCRVVGEIDLLADPGIVNLDPGSLTYDHIINDIDLLKEATYDALQDDELISSIEGLVDDSVDYGDVTVVGDGDTSSLDLALPGDDVTNADNNDVDGEGPTATVKPTTTSTTEKNVQTTRTTDPRLERFAEQLELITLPPDKRKRRKIELQLQKISVQNTEEQERKREEKKQRRLEKREKRKLEKLQKKKEKEEKNKVLEKNEENKKNDVINLLEEIDVEDSITNFKIIEDNNWVNRKLKSFNIEKKKRINKENISDKKEINEVKKEDGKEKKKEQPNIDIIEKRKAKQLSKGKERNLRILQRMIEKEERRLPRWTKKNDRELQSRMLDDNKVDYQRKQDLKTWRNMKDKLSKSKKEIRFLLKLKRGFGTRLDNHHKKEVAQQLKKLKRKYSTEKEKLKDFQKNNWELIQENKLYSKLNRLKKKISYLKKKKKKYVNTPNSYYKIKLMKRIQYLQNRYQKTKDNIDLVGKFEAKFEDSKSKYRKRNANGVQLKGKKIKSTIKALKNIEKQIDNDTDSDYKLKLKEKIKVLVEKYKKYRRKENMMNETKKEKRTRQLKEKMKRIDKKRKKGVDLATETKLVQVRDDLFKRYKTMRTITGYERRNKCYLRGEPDSKIFLRMQNIKEAIVSLKHKRRQMKSKVDKEQRTKLTNTIKRLSKSYRSFKKLDRFKHETKTERKSRILKEEIISLMKIKKQSRDQSTKIDLTKKIRKLVKRFKRIRKIIKYENKFECRYFGKYKKIKDKIRLLKIRRRQVDKYADYNTHSRLTNKIRHLIQVLKKYKKSERERNETENEKMLREMREAIKTNVKVLKSSNDLNIKAKLATQVKQMKEKYENLHLKVKYEGRNRIQIPRSYEKRSITKYYLRMESLKHKIKSLVKMKKQIRNEVDPRYKLKLNESINKLIEMYKKYKRQDKIKTETKKEKKNRKLKERLRSLKIKMSATTNSKYKDRLSKIINGLTERYKKVHSQVIYEKRNKCYLRDDHSNENYLKMERLRENIKLLIKERRALGSKGDPRQRLILKREIEGLRKKYNYYRKKVKILNETKNENKNRNLKEKIKDLIQLKKKSEDTFTKGRLSNKIKQLLKRYRKMQKIIKYENEYECRYYKQVHKIKDKVKELVKMRGQIKEGDTAQQKVVLSRKITNLKVKYKRYNLKEKTRKQTENGKKMRKLKEDIRSLATLKKNTDDLNKKADTSKKMLSLKNIYKNLRLIVKHEEKDVEQISKSYESRIKSRYYNKMQKLKPKIISLKREKREINKKEDSEHKVELRKRVTGLIKRYKKYKRSIKRKHNRKILSPKMEHLLRRKRDIQERRKHISQKGTYKGEDTAKRKRQQQKLRLRRRKERRARVHKRWPQKSSRKSIKSSRQKEGLGNDQVLPEGMAYCKSQDSKSGGNCQCWYLQDQS